MLKVIAEGVWGCEQWVRLVTGVHLPARMTVLRLQGGNLMVISPIHPSDEVVRAVRDLGQVRYIVSPTSMHHVFLNKFAAMFPEAEVWVPYHLHKKRPTLHYHGIIDTLKNPWSEWVECLSVPAREPVGEEIVFFHKQSRTLVVTDLLFNLRRFKGPLDILVALINGTYKKLAMSRLAAKFFSDKNKLRSAVARMLLWHPENLVMAHGEVVIGSAEQRLKRVFKI